MAKEREVQNKSPDIVDQFVDRISGFGFRDALGMPLGDVFGHATRRLITCYGIVEAAGLGADFGQVGHGDGIPGDYEFFAIGAVPQDRRGNAEFPAAHLAPCTLEVGNPKSAGVRPELYRIFSDGVSRSFVEGLFKRTELVHRLTNVADSACEGTKSQDEAGMARVLARSCKMILQDRKASPKQIFYERVVPDFQTAARLQMAKLETEMSNQSAGSTIRSGLVDQFGRPYDWDPGRTETRISSKAPAQARRINQQAVLQILNVYATTRAPQFSEINAIAGNFQALRANEQREAMNRLRRR